MRPFVSAILLIGLTLAAASPAQAEAPVRVALLAGEGERAVDPAALAQLEAALTGVKEIALLERAEIRKILAEQKLSAAGLDDPATAVKLGMLLSVEMFLSVDLIPHSNPACCRAQVIETQTGFALAADMIPESALGQKSSAVTELLAAALAKKRVAPADRHYVGLLEARSEEPGRSLDGWAEAAGMFLMSDLARSPNVVALDRERVERLTAEKALTGLELQLRTSSLLITLGLRRAAEKGKLDFTLELRPPGAPSGRILTGSAPDNDIQELRRALVGAVQEGLKMKAPAPSQADPRTEAEAFVAQSAMLISRNESAAALRAAEAAYALSPDQRTCMAAWLAWLARERAWNSRPAPFRELALENQREVLRSVIRQWTLAADFWRICARAADGQPPATMPSPQIPDYGARLTVMKMPADGFIPLQQELRAAYREARDLEIAYCRSHWDAKQVRNWYWLIWWREEDRLLVEEPGVDDLLIAGIRELVDAFANPPGPMTADLLSARMRTLGDLPGKMRAFTGPRPRSGEDAGRARYAALWREFQKHPDPFVRVIAAASLLCIADTDSDPEPARRLLGDLR